MRRLPLLPSLLPLILLVACTSDDHPEDASGLFEEAWQQERDSKSDTAQCSGVRVPDRPTFDNVVALTFDDGPNPTTTPLVMETLRRYGVPATFFINGRRVASETTQLIAQEIVDDELFILANHTWSHKQLTKQSARSVARQIDDTTVTIEDAGGEPSWFRFPYGASNCRTAQAVRQRGYEVVGWHIDSADWCFSTGTAGSCPASKFRYVDDDMRNNMRGYTMRQIRRRGGGIVLFHDIHRYTADQLEPLLDTLIEEGYRFTSIDDEDVFPRLNRVTDTDPDNN